MWPFARKRKRGPSGTQRLYVIGNYLFWDDGFCPGLVKDEYALKKVALSEAEVSDFLFAGATEVAKIEKYRAKMTKFLLAEAAEFRIEKWIRNSWTASEVHHPSQYLNFLDAYCQILSFWNYPVKLHTAYDERDEPAMAILSRASKFDTLWKAAATNTQPSQPAIVQHAFRISELQAIKGIPTNFTVQLTGAEWRFDYRVGELQITKK